MERFGSDSTDGKCGINIEASFPIKKGPNPPPSPPSPPSPIKPPSQCDNSHSCPASSTCCCAFNIGKYCLQWGCCPMESATCCEDHYHCCPSDFPVCNLRAGQCLKVTCSFRFLVMFFAACVCRLTLLQHNCIKSINVNFQVIPYRNRMCSEQCLFL